MNKCLQIFIFLRFFFISTFYIENIYCYFFSDEKPQDDSSKDYITFFSCHTVSFAVKRKRDKEKRLVFITEIPKNIGGTDVTLSSHWESQVKSMKSLDNYFVLYTSDVFLENSNICVVNSYVEGEQFSNFVERQNYEAQMGNFLSISV